MELNANFAWDSILFILQPFTALFTIAGVIYAMVLFVRRVTHI